MWNPIPTFLVMTREQRQAFQTVFKAVLSDTQAYYTWIIFCASKHAVLNWFVAGKIKWRIESGAQIQQPDWEKGPPRWS